MQIKGCSLVSRGLKLLDEAHIEPLIAMWTAIRMLERQNIQSVRHRFPTLRAAILQGRAPCESGNASPKVIGRARYETPDARRAHESAVTDEIRRTRAG
jgi:hypothetical protein